MKRFALVFLFCIGLLLTSGWLIMHPAGAVSTTITCRDGSQRTCSGQSCTGSDAIPGSTNGWCHCSGRIGQQASTQDCNQPPQ